MDINSFALGYSAGKKKGGSGGGGKPVVEKDVNFYDYDGTLLHSYTLAEAQALAELPELPTREGLICQEWNYDLDTIKSDNRAVNVGATYITDDGKTRLYITIAAEGRMDVPLRFRQTVENGVEINWGDGSETETYSGTDVSVSHTYASIGDYIISLDIKADCSLSFGFDVYSNMMLGSGSRVTAYTNMLKKLEIGRGVTGISNYAFYNCPSLERAVIPKSVTSIGANAFYSCYSLTGVVIPNGLASIKNSAFYNCNHLKRAVIPKSVTSIEKYAFKNCYSIRNVVIPNCVASIGNEAFYGCDSITSIVIPSGVTSIGDSVFNSCRSLASVVIQDGVTTIGNNEFSGCYSLTSIVIPNSVTKIGNQAFYLCQTIENINLPDNPLVIGSTAFYGCYSLASIVIPNGVTNINSEMLNACYSLASIVIPNSVTNIGSYAFQNCYSMKFYDFTAFSGIPTLSKSNAFTGIPSDCEIRVPASLYDSWKAATNWSAYADRIVAV